MDHKQIFTPTTLTTNKIREYYFCNLFAVSVPYMIVVIGLFKPRFKAALTLYRQRKRRRRWCPCNSEHDEHEENPSSERRSSRGGPARLESNNPAALGRQGTP